MANTPNETELSRLRRENRELQRRVDQLEDRSATVTPRQYETLFHVERWTHQHGVPPTCRELALSIDAALTTAFEHVEALIRKGMLSKEPRQSRSLQLTPAGKSILHTESHPSKVA
ncbi:MAG: hypothetical protein AAF432_00320 [Planctomycetota bacterium]